MWKLSDDIHTKGYKFEQIRDEIIKLIDAKNVDANTPLPTIIEVAEFYKLSIVTVARAYQHLKMTGYIVNTKGKFYVNQEKLSRLKILLVFNKLEDYKKNTYDAIQDAFNGKAKIDLQVYYSRFTSFIEILTEAAGLYDYYIVMPHFYHGTDVSELENVLTMIPRSKLLFIDKIIPLSESACGSIVQDFENDMLESLSKIKSTILKYKEIRFISLSMSHHPIETTNAIASFCTNNGLGFSIVDNIENESLKDGIIFIATTDKDLARLLKKIKNSIYTLGNEVGIIGYNETILKSILDVTVFSTNFYNMGKRISEMILNKSFVHEKNPFDIIIRNTL